jgi:peptidoglycan/xylan/chitin deacetylase (PgdA/CDA1 family)
MTPNPHAAPWTPPSTSNSRRLLAQGLYVSGMARLLAWLTAPPTAGIRVINYHQTLPANARHIESHLQLFTRWLQPCGPAALHGLLQGHHEIVRQGVLITFDDGLRSNFEVAAPLLEKYGFRGCFFVCPGLVECPPREQREYALAHKLPGGLVETPGRDGRVAMSWEDLASLHSRHHMIGCHTMTHQRLHEGLSDSELAYEIADSRALMMERLGVEIESFCWVGGEESAYSLRAAQMVAASGYRYGFMTCGGWTTAATNPRQIHRTNIEDRYTVPLASLQISGLPDYWARARRTTTNYRTALNGDRMT